MDETQNESASPANYMLNVATIAKITTVVCVTVYALKIVDLLAAKPVMKLVRKLERLNEKENAK